MEKRYRKNPNYDVERFNRIFHRWMQARRENDRERMMEEINQIYRFLEHFVYDILWGCCPEVMKKSEYREELVQNAWMEIMRVLPGYDPDKAMITTYIGIYVKHQGFAYCCEHLNGTTIHYASKFEKIRAAAERLEEQGYQVTETGLSQETDIAPKEIQKYLMLERRSQVHSLEELQENGEFQPPESPDSFEEIVMRGDLCRVFSHFVEKERLDQEEWLLLKILWKEAAGGRKKIGQRKLAVMMRTEVLKTRDLYKRKYYPEKISLLLDNIREKLKKDETICDYLE